MRLLLGVLSGCLLAGLLAGCGVKASGPLALYFAGSTRFTTGNRTVGPADTLSTNLYAYADTITDKTNPNRLTHFTVTVEYTPQRAPFAYPNPINLFLNNLPPDPLVTFMDSTLKQSDFLYTPVFGARTTSGTERWTFTTTDGNSNSSARSFVLAVRRGDSTAVFNSYTLNLQVPATNKGARRFIDLKSGLALPAYSVLGNTVVNKKPIPNPQLGPLQQLTDLIVLPDGLRLASPDTVGKLVAFNDTRWAPANRRSTRFRLTTLLPAGFTSLQDTVAIRNQFTGTGRAYLRTLAADQVYAFRVEGPPRKGYIYGLMRVKSVPNGTSTVGLSLEVRMAKKL
jgi:hypothetical protein